MISVSMRTIRPNANQPNFSSHLDVVFSKFLSQSSPSTRRRVHRVVYSNLAVLMVQPGIDIFTAFLEDLLAKDDG